MHAAQHAAQHPSRHEQQLEGAASRAHISFLHKSQEALVSAHTLLSRKAFAELAELKLHARYRPSMLHAAVPSPVVEVAACRLRLIQWQDNSHAAAQCAQPTHQQAWLHM